MAFVYEMLKLIFEHLLRWQALMQESRNARVWRWRMRPKHHALEELALFARRVRLNPRRALALWMKAF